MKNWGPNGQGSLGLLTADSGPGAARPWPVCSSQSPAPGVVPGQGFGCLLLWFWSHFFADMVHLKNKKKIKLFKTERTIVHIHHP